MVIIMCVPPGEGLPCVLMGLSSTVFVLEHEREAEVPHPQYPEEPSPQNQGRGHLRHDWAQMLILKFCFFSSLLRHSTNI